MVGLNNQNFLMRDVETGSWWQQVSGKAILGPLKGKQLELIPSGEVNWGIWKAEHRDGQVLVAASNTKSTKEDWDATAAERMFAVRGFDESSAFEARELIVGVEIEGIAKAYPLAELVEQNPVIDAVGSARLLFVAAEDGKSVRCFDRRLDGEILELFQKPDAEVLTLVDSLTGSEWDFSGRAVSGPSKGKQLQRINILKDFWFDWKEYHPDTLVFSAGRLKAKDRTSSLRLGPRLMVRPGPNSIQPDGPDFSSPQLKLTNLTSLPFTSSLGTTPRA